jgi:hypothetical protein
MNYRAASRAVSEQQQLLTMNLFVVLFLTLFLYIPANLILAGMLTNCANEVTI